ncbi:thioredoxin [Archaeoglobus veneficus]|uniref:Thioredoxin n=1 Tax=Archaeoglobus veneficus (strain DSM 11195 / SNP6) TaxID=693661 RepID=F2KT05_ARCVS|nr:thioredoxin [Archaeoglobus veneficus]AEA47035.1 thioredoxin [Archaeoglobus veneficus SNP6]
MDELERIRNKKLKELMSKMSKKGGETVAKPVEVNLFNFDEVISNNENVVVDFWAEWCGPCRMLAPVIEELAKEYAGKVLFAKVNTDENEVLASRFGISAIPTLIYFKRGKPVDSIVGALPKSELKRWIERNLLV